VFTGIVRERGRIAAVDGAAGGIRIDVDAPATARDAGVGDSVSINGCCLTVVEVLDGHLRFDAVPETLSRSNLGALGTGSQVNLEPALRAGDALGGHYVQGHVDAVGAVRSLRVEGEGARLSIEAPVDVLRYCVEKGSITVEGVSLTIAELEPDAFSVALVPYTLAVTTLGDLQPADPVNLEVDVLAKYVERLIHP